jgi:hypothetical protein
MTLSVVGSSVGIVASICASHEGVRNSAVTAARYPETQHYVSVNGYKEQSLSSNRMRFSIYRKGRCSDPINSLDTLVERNILHLPEIEL